MCDEPLVSVHVVTYNQEEYIEETLRSALEQEYDNLEVVVGDDASTDRTPEIIMELASEYPGRLIPILGKERLGITGNCNRVLKRCRGKYIAFLGGDDVFLPKKIALQAAWMEASERRVLCAHQVSLINEKGQPLGRVLPQRVPGWAREGEGNKMVLRSCNIFPACSVMVRRSAIPAYGFDARLPIVSDWKLWIDVVSSNGCFGFIDGVYAKYRIHSQNITSTATKDIAIEGIKTIILSVRQDKELFPYAILPLINRMFWLVVSILKSRAPVVYKFCRSVVRGVRFG